MSALGFESLSQAELRSLMGRVARGAAGRGTASVSVRPSPKPRSTGTAADRPAWSSAAPGVCGTGVGACGSCGRPIGAGAQCRC